ncbi:MAG: SPOCS domain-containing protein [Coprococcus sp.]
MLTDTYMLQTSRFQSSTSLQITLDNDFNVPDNKPDMEKPIADNGDVQVQNIKVMRDKLMIKGVLTWHLLYLKDRKSCTLDHLEGELPFEEIVNMDGLTEEARVRVDWEMEDLRMTMIHSRKISVRSILNFKVMASCMEEVPVVTDINEEDKSVCIRKEERDISRIAVRKRDTVRIREEMNLPGNKANMLEILWGEVQVRHLDVKLQDEKILLRGDGAVFILYSGEKEENPFEYAEADLPWHTEIPCSGLQEDMIANIHLHKISQSLEMKADRDGEMRSVTIEIVLDMDMEAYEENNIQVISDIYSLNRGLLPVYKEVELDHILIRNQSECKIYEKIKMPGEQASVLQICHPWAEVKLDRLEMVENGIRAEGVVDIRVLYVNVDDHLPLDIVGGMVPFSCIIETGKLPEGIRFEVQPYIDQLSAVMTDSDAAEVKITVRMDTMVYTRQKIHIMTAIQESELDDSYMESLPNMIGYVVQKEDDLFGLGKKFCTTQEAIMAVNGLEKNEIAAGDRLLIMKHMAV